MPFPFRSIWVLILGTFCGGLALGAEKDDLLQLVPEDATITVVLHDLREKSAKEGSFAGRLEKLPILARIQQSPEVKPFIDGVQSILREVKVSPGQLRDDVLGDLVVLSFKQASSEKDEDQGLMLLYARDEQLLGKLIDRLNELQIKSGEVAAIEEVAGKEQKYYRRRKANGKGNPDYYWFKGHTLAFSDHAKSIEDVISRNLAPPKNPPAILRRMELLGVESKLLSILINPRTLDGELGKKILAAASAEKAFLQQFSKYWSALDDIAFHLDFDRDLTLGVTARLRTGEIPASALKFFGELGRPCSLWKAIPDDALVAVAGNIDFSALVDLVGEFTDQPTRSLLHKGLDEAASAVGLAKEKLDGLEKGLGPEVGFWVAAPTKEEKTWVPQGIFALKFQPTEEGQATRKVAESVLHTLAGVLTFGDKWSSLHTVKQGKVEVEYLENSRSFPEGFRPCYASKEDYLLLATRPEMIGRFSVPAGAATTRDGEVLLARVSLSGLAKYFGEHRNALADFLPRKEGKTREMLLEDIGELELNLKHFDKLEVVHRAEKDRVSILLRVTMPR